MKAKLDVIVNVATLIAALLVSVFLAGQWIPALRPPQGKTPERQFVNDVTGTPETSAVSSQRRKGNSRTVLIEFSDFQCPYCGAYARSTYPQIEHDYVETGRVQYWFRHLPLESHAFALGAAVAAQCAEEQGKFWSMHDRLFRNQAALEPDDLVVHAERLDLNLDSFHKCMDSGRIDIVEKDRDEARRLGVMTTPTFFLGTLRSDGLGAVIRRVINGSQPYPVFKSELERAILAFSTSTD